MNGLSSKVSHKYESLFIFCLVLFYHEVVVFVYNLIQSDTEMAT